MLNELINLTNSSNWEDEIEIQVVELKGKIDSFTSNNLEIILDLKKIRRDETERWIIYAKDVLEQSQIFQPIFIPYDKVNLIKSHPILWKYKFDSIECEIHGKYENMFELTGKIQSFYEEISGNWIDWRRDFFTVKQLNEKGKFILQTNSKIFEELESLLKSCSLKIESKDIRKGKEKGYLNKDYSQLLIFGNELVSPNSFNLGQPYIIASSFEAKRINNVV